MSICTISPQLQCSRAKPTLNTTGKPYRKKGTTITSLVLMGGDKHVLPVTKMFVDRVHSRPWYTHVH